jgi:hypothetical protein
MVFQSNPSINMALFIVGILAVTSITQAQLSNVPIRYRNRSANRKMQQHREVRTSSKGQRPMLRKTTTKNKARKLVDESISLPIIDQASFNLSSAPITESRVDISSLSMFADFHGDGMSMMSMPDFDSCMSLLITEPPSETRDTDFATGKGNGGKALMYAGFLVGMSAMVFAAAAMFAKMRRVHAGQVERS